VRRKLAGTDDGDRQMVAILSAVLTDGLSAVETACAHTRQREPRSADRAPTAYLGQDCDDQHDRNPSREELSSRLNPAKSSSTSDPPVRRSDPAPLKSP